MVEIEAKLMAADRRALDRVSERVRLNGWLLEVRRTRLLESLYLETPDGDLSRARIGCRVRKRGRSVEATIKLAGDVRRGVHARPEFTVTLGKMPRFPWRLPSKLRGHLPEHLADLELRPMLRTSIRRRLRALRRFRGGPMIAELALDEVAYRSPGERGEPARDYEIEIELFEGNRKDLTSILRALRRVVRLRPARHSKLERGLAYVRARQRPLRDAETSNRSS